MPPRRPPKGRAHASFDDDPFFDSWDAGEPVQKLVAPNRTRQPKNTKKIAASANDPFGPDGFGDDWEYKPSAKFACDIYDTQPPQEDFSSAEFDWGCSRARRQAEEAKRKKNREEWLRLRIKKKKEVEAQSKAKAEMEAKEKAEAEAAKIAAMDKWQIKMKQATDCVAFADPAQALKILYSLSLENENFLDCIDEEKKKEVRQIYTALLNHFELQTFLASTLVAFSSYLVNDCSDDTTIGSDTSSDDTTIGGDTVKVHHSNTEKEAHGDIESDDRHGNKNTIVVVDRLPTDLNSETNQSSETDESNSSNTTIGGDTVKLLSSNGQSKAEKGDKLERNQNNAKQSGVLLVNTNWIETRCAKRNQSAKKCKSDSNLASDGTKEND